MDFDDVENLPEEQILEMYKDIVEEGDLTAVTGYGHVGGGYSDCYTWGACDPISHNQYRSCADYDSRGKLVGHHTEGQYCK